MSSNQARKLLCEKLGVQSDFEVPEELFKDDTPSLSEKKDDKDKKTRIVEIVEAR